MQTYTIIGFLAVLFVFAQLVKSVGKDLPVMDLSFLIAGLQWIVGPYLDYQTTAKHFKYYMYVSEYEYMQVVVPIYIVFLLPYYIFRKRIKLKELQLTAGDKLAPILMGIGVFAIIISPFVPPALAFIVFLLRNFLYIGTGLILFQKSNKLNRLAYISIGWLFYSAIDSGHFHAFILWGSFLFFLWVINKNIKWYMTVAVFVVAFFSASVIQSVKHGFRAKLLSSKNPIELFATMFIDAATSGVANTDEDLNTINVRLNQGWIISAIIKNVPKNEPYAQGETINTAIFSSVLPRFLAPNKANASGRANFIRFTGLPLHRKAAMGTSVIGEAYANYGRNGAMLFMFIWGALLTLFWNFLLDQVRKNPLILFFIPLIFLQAVKAESELVVVLNHLTKASILTFIIISFFRYPVYTQGKTTLVE